MYSKGFSLIELIVVIILIGILAVSVAPKFEGTASYEVNSHRAQLISALRLTQQRAMQQTDTDDYCHEIVFDFIQSRYGIPNRISCVQTDPIFLSNWEPDATGHIVDENYDITFNINGSSTRQTIGFDWMGRPTKDCTGGCEVNIIHPTENTLTVYIEQEGYINVFDELH